MIRCRKNPLDIFMAEQLTGQPPIFGGSTGGLLTKALVEEKYAITWTSPKEQVFEMPTGGAAIMRQGDNLLYLPRKEQCIALGGQQLRAKFKITNYKIYRVFPDGNTEYLHPKDGVFPEKVNEGRPYNGKIERNIGSNPNPAKLKFSGKKTFDP
jgi:photosystem I subunit 2